MESWICKFLFLPFPHSFWTLNIRHISSGGWKWLVSTALCYQSASWVFVFMIMHDHLHLRYILSFLMHFTVVNIFNIELFSLQILSSFFFNVLAYCLIICSSFSLYGSCPSIEVESMTIDFCSLSLLSAYSWLEWRRVGRLWNGNLVWRFYLLTNCIKDELDEV